jgi:membrane-associated phospholipid phosphatase
VDRRRVWNPFECFSERARFVGVFGSVGIVGRHERKTMAVYALSVSVATVYGRYHYGVDALAGFAVSLVAIPAARLGRERT